MARGALWACVLGAWFTAASASSAAPGPVPRYFDSSRGVETGDCLRTAPCRRLARYRLVARPGDPMVLVDGSVFRDVLPIVGRVAISRSNTGATMPVVSGADVASGPWRAEGGNIWSFGPLTHDPVVVFHDGMIGDGKTIGRAPRKVAREALARPWDYFWDPRSRRLLLYALGPPSAGRVEYGVRQRYADVIDASGVSIDGIAFVGARGGGIGVLAYRSGGAVLQDIAIRRCRFGPAGGQHVQFNGASGAITGNAFLDWNVEGAQKFYAWQGIAAPGMDWRGRGAIVSDNTFALTAARTTVRDGLLVDSGAITSDVGYWPAEIARNRMDLNGLGGGVLIYQPPRVAGRMLVARNVVNGANAMALDVTDFNRYGAVADLVVAQNRFSDSVRTDLIDLEAVRFRDIPTGRIDVAANLIDRTRAGRHAHPAIGIASVGAHLQIANNTVYRADAGIEFKGPVRGPVSVLNTLFVANRAGALAPASVKVHRFEGSLVADASILGGDFRPKPGSTVRNAGVRAGVREDLMGRPFADPPTIGALEAN